MILIVGCIFIGAGLAFISMCVVASVCCKKPEISDQSDAPFEPTK